MEILEEGMERRKKGTKSVFGGVEVAYIGKHLELLEISVSGETGKFLRKVCGGGRRGRKHPWRRGRGLDT